MARIRSMSDGHSLGNVQIFGCFFFFFFFCNASMTLHKIGLCLCVSSFTRSALLFRHICTEPVRERETHACMYWLLGRSHQLPFSNAVNGSWTFVFITYSMLAISLTFLRFHISRRFVVVIIWIDSRKSVVARQSANKQTKTSERCADCWCASDSPPRFRKYLI